jgi:cystathionine gamma-synthase
VADKSWGFSTRAVHVGQGPDLATGAVVQPIHLATTFAQQGVGRHQGYEYSRSGNPTRAALEECLASLEQAKHALAFASGLGAESTLLLLLKPNDHVVYMEDVYGGTYRLFDKVMRRFGVTFTAVDASDLDKVEAAITPATRLVWLESPSNPLLRIVDIDAVSEIAHGHDVKVCVDNTFATPYLQQPLHLGADVVVHSATKYIGGHSDVVGGALMTSDDELEKSLRFHQNAVGAVPSPFDCWLLLRGIKTLALRVERQSDNAMIVARALQGNPAVSRVHYPGLETHAHRAVVPSRHRADPRGHREAVHRGVERVDRDHAVQLRAPRAGRAAEGGHPGRGRQTDGVQHDRHLGRDHHGDRGHEDLARQPRGDCRLDRAGRSRPHVRCDGHPLRV